MMKILCMTCHHHCTSTDAKNMIFLPQFGNHLSFQLFFPLRFVIMVRKWFKFVLTLQPPVLWYCWGGWRDSPERNTSYNPLPCRKVLTRCVSATLEIQFDADWCLENVLLKDTQQSTWLFGVTTAVAFKIKEKWFKRVHIWTFVYRSVSCVSVWIHVSGKLAELHHEHAC